MHMHTWPLTAPSKSECKVSARQKGGSAVSLHCEINSSHNSLPRCCFDCAISLRHWLLWRWPPRVHDFLAILSTHRASSLLRCLYVRAFLFSLMFVCYLAQCIGLRCCDQGGSTSDDAKRLLAQKLWGWLPFGIRWAEKTVSMEAVIPEPSNISETLCPSAVSSAGALQVSTCHAHSSRNGMMFTWYELFERAYRGHKDYKRRGVRWNRWRDVGLFCQRIRMWYSIFCCDCVLHKTDGLFVVMDFEGCRKKTGLNSFPDFWGPRKFHCRPWHTSRP